MAWWNLTDALGKSYVYRGLDEVAASMDIGPVHLGTSPGTTASDRDTRRPEMSRAPRATLARARLTQRLVGDCDGCRFTK